MTEVSSRHSIGETLLSVERINLAFGEVKALANVSFNVREHEVLAIIGPNGAGKTSRAGALDGHHILLCLNAAARLGRSLKTPTSTKNTSLLKLWTEPEARRSQLIRMLGLEVSDDATTVAFRRLWRRNAIPGALE